MSKFTDRLWRELVRDHSEELSALEREHASRARVRRPRLLAGSTVGLAGIGTVIALVLSAAGSTPAFAVTQNHDGSVSVWIRTLSGIGGANQRLHTLGVRAVAVQVMAGCPLAASVTHAREALR